MRRPRWLDRELRIRGLNVLLVEANREKKLFHDLWVNMTAEVSVARVQAANALIDLRRAERYRIAWRRAYDRAKRRREWVDEADEAVYAADRHRADVIEDRDKQIKALQRHLEEVLLRHNRLRDEYLTERARLMDALAKYEGNPS